MQQGRLGGVIFFSRNFSQPLAEPAHLAEAAALCVEVAAAAPPGPPPVLSIDQEGGRVQRLRAPFTEWPPMACLAGGDPSRAEQVGRAIADELCALGLNLDYAPVLDVHTNPANPVIGDRAMGAQPEEVILQALAFLRGLESAGVRGCGKHFPGHGDTAQDSHLVLPEVQAERGRLMSVEVAPFRAAVRAGIQMLMTAHVVYPAVDGRPATLSRVWLQDILRRELGFRGVIVSDDLDMRAVAGADIEDVVVEALLSGCDAFLLCRDEERQLRAEEALYRAADRDARVRDRIEESGARLRRFRASLRPPCPNLDRLLSLPDPAHQALARLLAG